MHIEMSTLLQQRVIVNRWLYYYQGVMAVNKCVVSNSDVPYYCYCCLRRKKVNLIVVKNIKTYNSNTNRLLLFQVGCYLSFSAL